MIGWPGRETSHGNGFTPWQGELQNLKLLFTSLGLQVWGESGEGNV